MTLATTTLGNGPRVVLLHGFTQNARCWGGIPERLAADHEVVLIDAPGHGESVHDDADLWAAAELVAEVGGRATYIGYSMGGRMALHLALQRPDLVERLVLIGATAGLESEDGRAERRLADERIAQRLDAADADGFRSFLEDWIANPLFASLPPASQRLDERATNRPAGLAASLRACGTGTQDSLWPRLGELTMPVALVVGSADDKFTALARRMAKAIGPQARVMIEPGSHAVHLENEGVIERAFSLLDGGPVDGEAIE